MKNVRTLKNQIEKELKPTRKISKSELTKMSIGANVKFTTYASGCSS